MVFSDCKTAISDPLCDAEVLLTLLLACCSGGSFSIVS